MEGSSDCPSGPLALPSSGESCWFSVLGISPPLSAHKQASAQWGVRAEGQGPGSLQAAIQNHVHPQACSCGPLLPVLGCFAFVDLLTTASKASLSSQFSVTFVICTGLFVFVFDVPAAVVWVSLVFSMEPGTRQLLMEVGI